MRFSVGIFTFACLAPFALLAAAVPSPPTSKPNIVFILADDLGIHDLACYGREDQPTPHISALAKQGLRFTSAYCALPICSPSRAAILTGKAPARLHLTTFLPGRANCAAQRLLHPEIMQHLPLEEVTLAEHLRALGYATACIGKWHLGGKEFGPDQQGFDLAYAGKPNTPPSNSEGGKGEFDLTAQAEAFISQNKERPFFLYLPHNNPHIPLAAQANLVAKHQAAFNPLYAAVVETLDASVGRLMARLDELKLAENTIFIFTSDNGGLHVPEGPHTPATYNGPFRAGKGYLYEGGLRVPLVVRWPGHVRAGTTCATPTINTDWLPTLLELCGAPPPEGLDGLSMAPLLRGEPGAERTFYWHFPHYTNQGGRPAGAVRAGDWKFVELYDSGQVELYNLAADVGETRNLAAQEPQRAARMRASLAAWRKTVGAQENAPNPNFNAAAFRELYEAVDPSRLDREPTAAAMRLKYAAWHDALRQALENK